MITCIFNRISAMVNINMTSILWENFVLQKQHETVLLNYSVVTQVRSETCHKYLLLNTVEVLKLANNLHLKIYLEQPQGYLCGNITLTLSHADMPFRRSEVQYIQCQKLCLGICFTCETHMLRTTAQGHGLQRQSFDRSYKLSPQFIHFLFFQALKTGV